MTKLKRNTRSHRRRQQPSAPPKTTPTRWLMIVIALMLTGFVAWLLLAEYRTGRRTAKPHPERANVIPTPDHQQPLPPTPIAAPAAAKTSKPTETETNTKTRAADGPELPVTTSWFGNSYSLAPQLPFAQRKWVPHELNAIAVDAHGRVYGNARADEAHNAWPIFEDGVVRPAKNVWHGGCAIALGNGCVYYARNKRSGHYLVQYELLSDGSLGEKLNGVRVNQIPMNWGGNGRLDGMAVDQKRNRVYVSDTTNDRVKVYRATDLFPLNPDGFAVPRPGKIAVAPDGTLWIVSERRRPRNVPLKPATNVKGTDWIGIDLGANGARTAVLARIQAHRYKAVDAVFQASTDGKRWTTIGRITARPANGGLRHNYYHLDNRKPHRFYRYQAPNAKAGLARGLVFYGRRSARPGLVAAYRPDGKPRGPEIRNIEHPTGICFDRRGRLLVADGGKSCQVHAFTNLNNRPQRDTSWRDNGRFGIYKGVFAGAGAAVGRVGPQRFLGINAVAVDARDNLYICQYGVSIKALEAYDAAGQRLWRVHSTGFMNAATDPADETLVFEDTRVYKMDYSKRAGGDAELIACTIDPYSYPQDPRVTGYLGLTYTCAVRRIHGRLFQFQTNQHGGGLMIWKFNGDDHIARPCGRIAGAGSALPHVPQGSARWIWLDKNNNGAIDAGEYDQDSNEHWHGDRGLAAHWVDELGNVWLRGNYGGHASSRIFKLAVARRLDQHGTPVWSWTAPENRSWPVPEEFAKNYNQVHFIRPLADGKTILLAGHTKAFREEGNQNKPNSAGVLVAYRIDGDRLEKLRELRLPWDNEKTVWTKRTKTIVPCGKYLFAGQQSHMRIHIYKLDTFKKVGYVNLGPVTSRPIFDGEWELTVTKRNEVNEYLLFMGNYHASSQLMLRWRPDANHRLFPPQQLLAEPDPETPKTAVRLDWSGSTKRGFGDYRSGRGEQPDAYVIDIKRLTPNGWSDWRRLPDKVDGDALAHVVTALQPGRHYGFQLRGVNDRGASDFSNVAYIDLGREVPQAQLWGLAKTSITLAKRKAADCDTMRLRAIGIFTRRTQGIPLTIYLDNLRIYGVDKNGRELVLLQNNAEDGKSPFSDKGSFVPAPSSAAPRPGGIIGDLGDRVYATTATAKSDRLYDMRSFRPRAAGIRIPGTLDRTKAIRVRGDAAVNKLIPNGYIHLELLVDFYKDGKKIDQLKTRIRQW